MRRAVIYLRVSTLDQTTANQERELREIAGRMGCEIVKVYKDHGISGTRGRVIVRERIPALAVGADPFLDNNRDRIIALAARHAVFANMQSLEAWRAMGSILPTCIARSAVMSPAFSRAKARPTCRSWSPPSSSSSSISSPPRRWASPSGPTSCRSPTR
jgi:Resolvase, N terminal domain